MGIKIKLASRFISPEMRAMWQLGKLTLPLEKSGAVHIQGDSSSGSRSTPLDLALGRMRALTSNSPLLAAGSPQVFSLISYRCEAGTKNPKKSSTLCVPNSLSHRISCEVPKSIAV